MTLSGSFTAPFSGIHGWYWENPGGESDHGDCEECRLLHLCHRAAVGPHEKAAPTDGRQVGSKSSHDSTLHHSRDAGRSDAWRDALVAHEAFRIVGTITKRQGTQLGVKTKAGRTVWVELKKTTIILRDKTKVAATELKPGLSVVVDALGDDDSDLEAKQVRIVPPIAPSTKPLAK